MATRSGGNVDRRRVSRDGGSAGVGLREMGEMEGCLEGFHVRKHRCRLDELDMLVQVLRKTVGRRADDRVTRGVVCPNVVFLRGIPN